MMRGMLYVECAITNRQKIANVMAKDRKHMRHNAKLANICEPLNVDCTRTNVQRSCVTLSIVELENTVFTNTSNGINLSITSGKYCYELVS